MTKYVIEDTTLTNTANAIREKTGGTEPITPSNFATEIAGIQSGGGSSVTKGLVINEYDKEGYPIDISIVGMEELISYYFYANSNETTFFSKVKNINLPDSITSIPEYCFYGCRALNFTNPRLPRGVTLIDRSCFYCCYSLKKLIIPSENLSEIGKSAFTNAALEKVVLENVTSVPTLGSMVFDGTSISKGGIYVPDALVENFKSSTNWSSRADYIKPISELEGN